VVVVVDAVHDDRRLLGADQARSLGRHDKGAVVVDGAGVREAAEDEDALLAGVAAGRQGVDRRSVERLAVDGADRQVAAVVVRGALAAGGGGGEGGPAAPAPAGCGGAPAPAVSEPCQEGWCGGGGAGRSVGSAIVAPARAAGAIDCSAGLAAAGAAAAARQA